MNADLEAAELLFATLKRRREHWRSVPVPEDLVHELALVPHLRRAQANPRGRKAALWPITHQAAHRQVGALMRAAGIEGPQACPRGLRHGYGWRVRAESADQRAIFVLGLVSNRDGSLHNASR